MELTYQRYHKDYEFEVCCLLNSFHPNRTNEYAINSFKWFYYQCPYINESEKIPLFISINENNKVVGIRGFFTLKYHFNNESFYSLGASGAYVHSDYRKFGVFNKLNNLALSEIEKDKNIKLFLNLSSNNKSTPGYLKLGWEKMPIKTYLYRYNYFKFFKKNKNNFSSSYKGYDIVVSIKDFEKEIEVFNFDDNSKFSLLRDKDYFRWRLNNPLQNNTILIKVLKNNKVVAYAILNESSNQNFRLYEYKYINIDSFKILIKYILNNTSYNLLSVWALSRNHEELSVFFKNGFVHFNERMYKAIGKPKMPALVRPNKVNINNNDWYLYGKDIRDINNWDLYYSDIDG